MGWNLLGPLVQILLKKEENNLPHCLAILTHLLEVCLHVVIIIRYYKGLILCVLTKHIRPFHISSFSELI